MTTKPQAKRLPGTVWKDTFLPSYQWWRVTGYDGRLWPLAYKTKKMASAVLARLREQEAGK